MERPRGEQRTEDDRPVCPLCLFVDIAWCNAMNREDVSFRPEPRAEIDWSEWVGGPGVVIAVVRWSIGQFSPPDGSIAPA